jgi:spermidine synthase
MLLGIGILNLLNLIIFENIALALNNLGLSLSTFDTLLFFAVFILLALPSFLMGGLIPVTGKILISNSIDFEKRFGKIYALETLGSTLGGLFAGFVLLGLVGQKYTFYTAISLNFLLGLILLYISKYNKRNEHYVIENNYKSNKINQSAFPNSALSATFVFGFAILALQILWIRIFKTYFTNTSYTFALITAFVILGLSIGSIIFRQNGQKIKNTETALIKLLTAAGFLSVFGLIFLYKLPELLLFPFADEAGNQWIRLILLPAIASILVILPPTIISGFAFPLASKIYSNKIEETGKNLGKILMYNTIGSVIGPLAATYFLIPILGVGKSILIIIALFSATAFFLLKHVKIKNNSLKYLLIGKFFIILLIVIFSDTLQFVPPSVTRFKTQITEYKETVEATITVVNEAEKRLFGNSTFVNNSAVIGSSYDAVKAVKMIGHLPFFAGLKCKNVLIIGYGIGITSSAIASHPEVEHIDCIELAKPLVESAHLYSDLNKNVQFDPRFHLISGDGRHFLQASKQKYDLISSDPTHPVLGSGNLYTQEFFQECYQHLNQGGMVSQYLPLHKLRLEDLLGIIKTFHSVFDNSSVWLGQFHAILIGRKGDEKIDFPAWKSKIENMPKDDYFYLDAYHIAVNAILDKTKIEELTKSAKINCDNRSYTEFFSFDCFDSQNIYINFKYLTDNRCKPKKLFENIDNLSLFEKYLQGNIKLNESIYYSLTGERTKSLLSLQKAVLLNPEDQEYPFLIKFNF